MKSLINHLELAYSPLTAYEFAILKDDPKINDALYKASIYIIAQRPAITIENLQGSTQKFGLDFEIHQEGNPEILKCYLPIDQENIALENPNYLEIAINYLHGYKPQDFELNTIHGFSLVDVTPNNRKFLIWFSPEKLLQNWWKGIIECEIDGNWKSFLNYKVHYVGKATKQNILKRLKAHSTFQNIISLEQPVTPKQLPANEIVILPFEFQENLQIQSYGKEDDLDSLVELLMGRKQLDEERIFLDAEKALIRAMQPHYNKELFKNYPRSKDGLFNENYDALSYSFVDPITLHYNEGAISGSTDFMGGDFISVKNNKDFRLFKMNEL